MTQVWLTGLLGGQRSQPGPSLALATECRPSIQVEVVEVTEEAFTLVLAEEGEADLSCVEQTSGRSILRQGGGNSFNFTQLQVVLVSYTMLPPSTGGYRL